MKKGTREQVAGLMAVGGLICGSGAFTISACFLPPPGGFGTLAWWSLRAGLVLLGVFELSVGNSLLMRAERLNVGVIPSFTPLPAGSYILYLRNFGDDRRLGRPQRVPGPGTMVRAWFLVGRSEEKRIAAALRWAGPVVGVGVPGERMPNDGVLRMDLPDDWQGPVRNLIENARLVVLVLGAGPGTLWELGESMRTLPPERLLLLNRMKSAEYEQFRQVARQELRAQADEVRRATGRRWAPPMLPDPPADRRVPSQLRGIVHFTGNWRPTYVALPRVPLPEDYLLGALDRALWVPMVQLTALSSP